MMRTTVQPLLVALCHVLSGQPQAAASELPTKIQFDLDAQPLREALSAWREQSGWQLIWPKEDTAAPTQSTPKVSGLLFPAEALSLLLSGTGLTYSYVDPQTVAIELASKAATVDRKSNDTRPVDGEPSRKVRVIVEASRLSDDAKRALDPLDEVVVTGTHIRGVTPAGSRVVVLQQKDIRRSDPTTTERVFLALPQTVRSGANGESADARLSAGSGASTNISFGSGINIRGLGSTATLTLVNGHRIAASGHGFVTDVSQIPVAAISRIEVLSDGISAVYGSDAIAGVVNIILKDDFDGAETRVRYGVTEPPGREEVRASQSLGAKWERGSMVAVASYLDQTQLNVDERSFTANVLRPASIFPSNRQVGIVVAGHQVLGDALSMRTDAQYGHTRRFALGSAATGHLEFPIDIHRAQGSLSVHYEGIEGWEFAMQGQFSQEDTDFSFLHVPRGSGTPALDSSEVQNHLQSQWTGGVSASGRLGKMPAGNVELALGVLHREEDYRRALRSPIRLRQEAARTVDSAYLELHIPIVGPDHAVPGARRMRVSLAGRYDDYSDFGGITNPRIGLSWMPVSTVEVRSTYSRSFRAPATGTELLSTSPQAHSLVSIYSFQTADGTATIPVAVVSGPRKLDPEKARNWTAGVTFRPPSINALTFDLTYYDILYFDRIVGPPLDPAALANPALQSFITHFSTPAQLQAAVANEVLGSFVYVDRTGSAFQGGAFGPSPQDLATDVFDARLANAGEVRTSGFDVAVHYSTAWKAGQLELDLSATHINEIRTVFAPGAPALDSVGTTGNPAGLRLRAGAAFSRGAWDAAFAFNFTDRYTDTTGVPHRTVSTYTTTDASVCYTFTNNHSRALHNTSIRLSVTNLFDEQPPYISGALATRGANYDTANADPLGRFIALEFAKGW
jgi:iron complex outermembrane recepter protein